MTINQSKKILIVDDHPGNLLAIVSILEEYDGSYNLYSASNGKLAVEIASKEIPDLIIMDWEMPVMDGIQAVKILKEQDSTKNIPVVMATGVMTDPQHLQIALEAGAVDYIRKPVHAIELIARIRSAIILGDSIKQINAQKDEIERKNKTLSESEKRYKQLANSTFEGLVIYSDIEILDVNQRFERMTSFNRSEIIGRSILKFIPDNFHYSFFEIVNQNEEESIEIPILTKSGGCFISEILTKTFGTNDNTIKVSAVRDITQRKKQDEILQKQRDKVFQQEKEIIEQKARELKMELDFKSRELTTNAMSLVESVELNNSLITDLQELNIGLTRKHQDFIRNLIQKYKVGSKDAHWTRFELQFEQVHEDFYNKLQQKFPELSPTDKKLCAFLRLNLTTKEIAIITHQSPKSVDVARSRLRNKLQLSRNENISIFLAQF